MCLQLFRFREEQVFWKDGRQAGSWPGTGLEEVGRISNGKSASAYSSLAGVGFSGYRLSPPMINNSSSYESGETSQMSECVELL